MEEEAASEHGRKGWASFAMAWEHPKEEEREGLDTIYIFVVRKLFISNCFRVPKYYIDFMDFEIKIVSFFKQTWMLV